MSAGRPALDRVQIVDAAVALIDRDGLDAFSMRKLGAELGVDPMSVYYHVPNKAALFDALVDWVWTRVDPQPPAPDASWRAIAAGIFVALRAELLAHPRLVPILGSRPVASPHMLDLTDRTLGWMDAAGLPPASGMQLLDCLMAFTVGKVLAEVRGGGDDSDDPGAVFSTLSPQTHPWLMGALMGGYGWQPDEEFTRGLDALLAGWPDA